MKILFLIKASGSKVGGHMFSLYHIAHEIAKYYDIRIITLGKEKSVIFSNSEFYLSNCEIDSLKKILSLNAQLKNTLQGYIPDIVHCFDGSSFLLASHIKCLRKCKFVLTKCGGVNPSGKYWIYADNLIVFSKENYDAIKSLSMYQNSNIYMIPNRVSKTHLNTVNFDKEEIKDKNNFNFVRIGRISSNYIKSTKSLLKLVAELPVFKKKYKIYIIGRIEDEEVYYDLVRLSNQLNIDAKFITDHRTENASQMLYLADCVLGTGRSLMEAMSLGLPTLTPVSNSDYPILVTKNNFEALFYTNFSERNTVPKTMQEDAYKTLLKIIEDEASYSIISTESLEIFKDNFSIENAIPKYKIVYDNSLKKKRAKFRFINFLYYVKLIKEISSVENG